MRAQPGEQVGYRFRVADRPEYTVDPAGLDGGKERPEIEADHGLRANVRLGSASDGTAAHESVRTRVDGDRSQHFVQDLSLNPAQPEAGSLQESHSIAGLGRSIESDEWCNRSETARRWSPLVSANHSISGTGEGRAVRPRPCHRLPGATGNWCRAMDVGAVRRWTVTGRPRSIGRILRAPESGSRPRGRTARRRSSSKVSLVLSGIAGRAAEDCRTADAGKSRARHRPVVVSICAALPGHGCPARSGQHGSTPPPEKRPPAPSPVDRRRSSPPPSARLRRRRRATCPRQAGMCLRGALRHACDVLRYHRWIPRGSPGAADRPPPNTRRRTSGLARRHRTVHRLSQSATDRSTDVPVPRVIAHVDQSSPRPLPGLTSTGCRRLRPATAELGGSNGCTVLAEPCTSPTPAPSSG